MGDSRKISITLQWAASWNSERRGAGGSWTGILEAWGEGGYAGIPNVWGGLALNFQRGRIAKSSLEITALLTFLVCKSRCSGSCR